MIQLKNSQEIETMREGGEILTGVLNLLFHSLHTGMKLSALDRMAEEEIIKRGGEPSFKKVKGYKWTICACVNDVVVHGIPGDYEVHAGDVLGLDCGVYYKGFHTDAAWTVQVKSDQDTSGVTQRGSPDGGGIIRRDDEINKFLEVGEKTLKEALKQVKAGNYIYDISRSIQENIESAGYSVVRSLVGHGVGRKLHEDPEIPGIVTNPRLRTPRIEEGMTLAVEVIYNAGKADVKLSESDGWTIRTKDGKISGLFEATVAVTNHGCVLLSQVQE